MLTGNEEFAADARKMFIVFFIHVVQVARTPEGISVPRGSQYGYTSASEELVPVIAFAKPEQSQWRDQG